MTVISEAQPDFSGQMAGERRFFFTMAIVMALVIVAGFANNLVAGRSSFALPILYHIHAFVFFGWVALYVTQNVLVATGRTALHRRLGWLAAAWVPAMLVVGTAVMVYDLRRGSEPPFFDINEFLIADPLLLAGFAVLVTAAIVNRRRTDWHRRLMYCAMAYITGPGLGRLLPLPFLIPWSFWIAAFVAPTIFPLIGIFHDMRRGGRAHPAWFWGMGTILSVLVLADVIAYSAPGYAITHAVLAGSPGAARDLRAHFP